MRPLTMVLVSLALMSVAAPALAQPGRACRPDAERLCAAAVAARDRDAAKACLIKNLDKVSEPCRERLKEAIAKQNPKGG